ncbi:hypothetical protein L6452_35037 [Arctium lappa]|uniref:Uncharacterized protein n=1 Tax=Arctium lappa TaxID=4217 RepID=A0ACB8YLD6_ARCLA|nr:hypothetical protein L6452_35037 [Arctium lappa]
MALLQGYDGIHDQTHGNHGDEEINELSNNEVYSGDSNSSSVGGGLIITTTKLRATIELAAQKHAFSERKRRKRINSHYDSLRQFFPRLLKVELKKLVADDEGGGCSFFIPGENDEMTVEYCGSGSNKKVVRATICCEDRPGLNQDLTETIQSVGGKAVKAEMATVGGRTKAKVVVEWPESGGGGEEDVETLKRALKAVVENRVLGRSRLMGTEPEFKVYENGLAQGLIMKNH